MPVHTHFSHRRLLPSVAYFSAIGARFLISSHRLLKLHQIIHISSDIRLGSMHILLSLGRVCSALSSTWKHSRSLQFKSSNNQELSRLNVLFFHFSKDWQGFKSPIENVNYSLCFLIVVIAMDLALITVIS